MDYNIVNLSKTFGMVDDIIKIIQILNWSDKQVLHLFIFNFRYNAKYDCCFEFNKNISSNEKKEGRTSGSLEKEKQNGLLNGLIDSTDNSLMTNHRQIKLVNPSGYGS